MAFTKDSTNRVDMSGLELVVDSMRKSDGTLVAASGDAVTPQSAPAANAGVAATNAGSAATNAGVAVTPATRTATTGSLPTPNGTTLFSDTSTPTAVELLDAVAELGKNITDLVTENATFKTTIDALIVENATFKTTIDALIVENATFKVSINAHRTALLAAGVYI